MYFIGIIFFHSLLGTRKFELRLHEGVGASNSNPTGWLLPRVFDFLL